MKTKISLLLVVVAVLFGCQQNMSSDRSKIKKGMIKVAIFYPNEEGKTFDMDYCSKKHMPMAASLFGDSLKAMSIDKGLANGTTELPVQYIAIGYFYFESMSSFQNSMRSSSEQIKADVPNYTNIQPELQISEVLLAD